MTTMYIDNKATSKKAFEIYGIDRNEYQTIKELEDLAWDCMNDGVYLIRLFEDGSELFTIRNHK